MRRMLRDFVGKRSHCPFKVRGEMLKKCALKGYMLWQPLIWWWQCGSVLLLAVLSDWQLSATLLTAAATQLKHHTSFTGEMKSQQPGKGWRRLNEKTLKLDIQHNVKTFNSTSLQLSQICSFAFTAGWLGSGGWSGGSVMLADVAFNSSHCSATLTVTFDYVYHLFPERSCTLF